MTKDEINLLFNQGYVKLPSLISKADPEQILSEKFVGTYSTNSLFQKEYHSAINLNEIIEQLQDAVKLNYNLSVDRSNLYNILRVVDSKNIKESYRMHFDSHLFTLVTPVLIPQTNSKESGQLVIFPKLRKELFGSVYNVFSKIYYKLTIKDKKSVENLEIKKGSVSFDFTDNIPILFMGRETLHGNRGFSQLPEGIRVTMLTHFFDPSSKYGLGNLVRIIRNR